MPLASPLPEVPRLQPLLRMLFLFLQAVVPTIPASFLTFGAHPLYRFYDDVPRLYGGVSALEDMRIAGLIMKIGAGRRAVGGHRYRLLPLVQRRGGRHLVAAASRATSTVS